MREATHRRLQNATIILGIILIGAVCGWTGSKIDGNLTITGDIVVSQDGSIGRDLTITDDLTVTDDCVFSDAISVAGIATMTTVISDTLKPGSGTAFYLRAFDGQDDADLNCADFSGALTGNVTGNVTGNLTGNLLGDAAQSITYKGNLPTAGDHTGEFYRNTGGDSMWYADDDSWEQLVPAP